MYAAYCLVALIAVDPAGVALVGPPGAAGRSDPFADVLASLKIHLELSKARIHLQQLQVSYEKLKSAEVALKCAESIVNLLAQVLDKGEFPIPAEANARKMIGRLREGSEILVAFGKLSEDDFGFPAEEILQLILDQMEGRAFPKEPTSIQAQLIRSAEGREGRDAVRVMVARAQKMAGEALAKVERGLALKAEELETLRKAVKDINPAPPPKPRPETAPRPNTDQFRTQPITLSRRTQKLAGAFSLTRD